MNCLPSPASMQWVQSLEHIRPITSVGMLARYSVLFILVIFSCGFAGKIRNVWLKMVRLFEMGTL